MIPRMGILFFGKLAQGKARGHFQEKVELQDRDLFGSALFRNVRAVLSRYCASCGV